MIEETDRPQAKVEGRINTSGSKRPWSTPRVIEAEAVAETRTGSTFTLDASHLFTSKS